MYTYIQLCVIIQHHVIYYSLCKYLEGELLVFSKSVFNLINICDNAFESAVPFCIPTLASSWYCQLFEF